MAAPTVLGIDIASGPPGTMVVITGTNLDDDITNVWFGTYDAGSNFTPIDETTLVAYVPEGTGTSLDVKVANPDGLGTGAALWSYDADEGGPGGGGGVAPTISDVTPNISANTDNSGGDTVVITGTAYTTAIYVWFGTVAASFTIDSDTQITATAPPNSGTVYVYVQNPYGTSTEEVAANQFEYPIPDAPTITTVVPAAGTVNTVVMITGTNFQTTSAVFFDVYTAAYQIMNDLGTSIRCYAPEGPAAGTAIDVKVVTEGGTATSTGAFTYLDHITDLAATAGPGTVTLTWSPVVSSSPVMYEVYGEDGVTPPTALITTTSQTTVTFAQDNADGDWYYAVYVVDIFGNKSAISNIVAITSSEVIATDITDGILTYAAFAADIMAPQVYSGVALPALPDTADPPQWPDGAILFWTVDNRLYRNLGGGPHSNSDTDKATWFDLSGNDYDGTLDAGFAWDATSGWAGDGSGANPYRLVLDGSTDHVDLPSGLNSLPSDKSASMECWFRTTAAASTQYLIYFSYSSGTHLWSMSQTSGNRLLAGYKDSVGTIFTASTGTGNQYLNDGGWHQGVVTLDSTTLKVYLDGLLLATTTGLSAGTLSPDTVVIGRSYGASPFNGDIACVRLYSEVLDATMVSNNFKVGPFGSGFEDTGLEAHYSAKRAKDSDAWVPMIDASEGTSLISGGQIIGNSITAGSIAAGAIGASEIASEAILVKNLLVGNYDNLIANANNEADYTGRDIGEASPDYEFRGVSTVNPDVGSKSRRLLGAASTTTEMIITKPIACQPGEKYYFQCRARLATETGSALLKIRFRDSAGSALGTTFSTTSITHDAYDANGDAVNHIVYLDSTPKYCTVPATAVTLEVVMETSSIGATNYLYVDQMYLRKALEGNLIVDGTITGTHIVAEVALDAPVITGGTLQTDDTGQRIVISGDAVNRIDFFSGHTSEITSGQGKVYSDADTNYAYLYLAGPRINSGVVAPEIYLRGGTSSNYIEFDADQLYFDAASFYAITGGYNYSPIIDLSGTTNDWKIGAYATNPFIRGDYSDTAIYFGGALIPNDDWGGGTSSDGVWIQDSDSTSLRWKVYFNSATPRLILRNGSTTHYFAPA